MQSSTKDVEVKENKASLSRGIFIAVNEVIDYILNSRSQAVNSQPYSYMVNHFISASFPSLNRTYRIMKLLQMAVSDGLLEADYGKNH